MANTPAPFSGMTTKSAMNMFLRGDVALALIGPGIDASHNYERAHMDGLNATTNWIMAYLLGD